jgi:hypothetical protein
MGARLAAFIMRLPPPAHRARRVLLSLIALALTAIALAAATYSSFSQTTANPSNSFSAGTVNISDNDAGATLSFPTMAPGTSASGCIRVVYTGSLASGVHLFGSVTGTLAPYLNLVVTRGSESAPSFPSCSSFSPDSTNYIGAGAGVVYSGTLATFASTYPSYASGLVDAPGASQTWNAASAHSYKLTVTLPAGAPAAAQGLSSTATFDWEAQNQ